MSRSETKSPRYLYLLRVRQLDQCPRGDAAAAGGLAKPLEPAQHLSAPSGDCQGSWAHLSDEPGLELESSLAPLSFPPSSR